MNIDELSNKEIQELIQRIEYQNKFNKISLFEPYEYQEKFYAAGAHYQRRFLMAGNRLGKSYGMAMELGYHLTGLYPPGWKGKVFTKPILAWAIGITGDSTRKVLQKVLLGVDTAKMLDQVGTGSIPRDCIDLKLLERDGHIVRAAKVRHSSGGHSTLEFRSTQQGESVLMGATVDFIWMDEEDRYNSMALYSQCATRTLTTSGQVVITATPENGLTELISLFQEDDTGNLYLQNATWDDALHLTPEKQEELLASIPEWQQQMRRLGIPVFGQGVVFNLKDSAISIDSVEVDNWDQLLWSVDIGKTRDPTVLTLNLKKETDDGVIYYTLEQYCSEEDRSPAWASSVINAHLYCNAPVVIPHDGANAGTGGWGDILKRHGPNVLPEVFYNPVQTSSDIMGAGSPHKRSIEAGLYQMEEALKRGTLKIHQGCSGFFREKNSYHRTGKQGISAFGGEDHFIDSCRYGFMSLLGNRGLVAGQCQKYSDGEEYNNGWGTDHGYNNEEQYEGNSRWSQ